MSISMNSMRMSLSIHKLTLDSWTETDKTTLHPTNSLWEGLSEKLSLQLSLEPWQTGNALQSGGQRVSDSGHDEAEARSPADLRLRLGTFKSLLTEERRMRDGWYVVREAERYERNVHCPSQVKAQRIAQSTGWWGGSTGGGVAQLVERQTRDTMIRGLNPVSTRKNCEFFRVKNVLVRCRCAQPLCVCIHMHENDHVHTLKILCVVHVSVRSITETRNTQHALVGLRKELLWLL